MIWGIICTILSQISFGITNSLWKNPQKSTNALSLIIARSFLTSILFGLVVLFSKNIPKLSLEDILLAFFSCAVNYFGLYFYLKSIKEKQISEVLGIGKFGVLIGIFGGYFYYQEPIKPAGIIGIVFIVLSIILIELWSERSKIKWNRSFFYAILSSIFWSSSFLFKKSILVTGPWLFSFILESTVFIMSILMLLLTKEKLKIQPLKNYKTEFTFLVILGFSGVVFENFAFKNLPIILLSLLNLVYPLTSYFFAGFYHKE